MTGLEIPIMLGFIWFVRSMIESNRESFKRKNSKYKVASNLSGKTLRSFEKEIRKRSNELFDAEAERAANNLKRSIEFQLGPGYKVQVTPRIRR